MGPAIALLSIIFIAVCLVVLLRRTALRRQCRRFAKRIDGQLVPGGWWGTPAIVVDDVRGRLTIKPRVRRGPGRKPFVRIQMPWPDKSLRCQVIRRHIERRWLRSDAQHGSAPFRKAFRVISNHPERAELILCGAVQVVLEQLSALGSRKFVALRIEDGMISVSKRGVLATDTNLATFVDLFRELYDQASYMLEHQIEFVDEHMIADAVEAVCKVCGDPLLERVVYCRRCGTAHHRECWRYFGKCTTFACGERYFLSARRFKRRHEPQHRENFADSTR